MIGELMGVWVWLCWSATGAVFDCPQDAQIPPRIAHTKNPPTRHHHRHGKCVCNTTAPPPSKRTRLPARHILALDGPEKAADVVARPAVVQRLLEHFHACIGLGWFEGLFAWVVCMYVCVLFGLFQMAR